MAQRDKSRLDWIPPSLPGASVAKRVLRHTHAAAMNPRAAVYVLAASRRNETLMRLTTRWPVTLAEKIRYKAVRDRRRLIGDFADKVRAKEYVARVVGPEYAVDILAVFGEAESLSVDELPAEFVMKVTHTSGGLIVARRDAPEHAVLPDVGAPRKHYSVRPEAFDLDKARALFAEWMATPHPHHTGEWAYTVHRPRIVVEPLLQSRTEEPMRDVGLHVMNGRVVMIGTFERDAAGEVRASGRYLRDGTPVTDVASRTYFGKYQPPRPRRLELPTQVDEMIEVAERLAAPTDYLRVDMFDLGDRFLVGELTNYNNGGLFQYRPGRFHRWLGAQLTLPTSYASLPDAPNG